MQYYVISVQDDSCFVLGSHAKDLAGARSSISWQRQGGFEQPLHICQYDQEGRDFVCIETGERFVPVQAFITDAAWMRFLESTDPEAAAAGGFGKTSTPTP